MKIVQLNPDDRPREKMEARGASSLSSAELLAIILRAGTKDINVVDVARNLLRLSNGSLTALSRIPLEELCKEKGVGKGKALSVLSALELGRRMMGEDTSEGGRCITSPDDVYDWMLPLLKGLDHEQCWAVYLGRGARIKGREMLSEGSGGSTDLDAASVARKCVAAKAARLVLVHNHPSGDPLPSNADIRLTADVKRALHLFKIELVDHVILSDGVFYSFSRECLSTR